MVEGGMKCIKYLLFFFNLIFVLVAIGLIAVGAYVQVAWKSYSAALGEFNSAAGLIIAVGVLIFFIAFFGCCGAIKENRTCVLAFATLLVIIFILETAGAIAGFVLKNKAEDLVKKYMEKALTSDLKFWNEVQKDFKCCGIANSSDWTVKNVSIPDSCCKEHTSNTNSTCAVYYGDGCLTKLVELLQDNVGYVAGVALGFAFIEIVGIIFACCLAVAIKKEYEVV